MTCQENAGLHSLYDAFNGHKKTQVLITTCELEIYDLLETSSRPLSSGEIALEKKINPDATERVLNTCVSLGLLKKNEEGCYSNTEISSKWLVKFKNDAGEPSAWGMAKFFKCMEVPAFSSLTDALIYGHRAGLKTFSSDVKERLHQGSIENMFASLHDTDVFISGMNGLHSPVALKSATVFDLSEFKTAIDVGAGSGVMVNALIAAYPHMKVGTFELPEVEDSLRKYIHKHEDQVQMHWGNFLCEPLPAADLYVMGHIIHDWQADSIDIILQNAFRSLNQGGAVLFLDKILPEKTKCGSVPGNFIDLMMLIVTGGRERTFTEYKALLERHGFTDIQWKKVGCGSTYDAVLARKI